MFCRVALALDADQSLRPPWNNSLLRHISECVAEGAPHPQERKWIANIDQLACWQPDVKFLNEGAIWCYSVGECLCCAPQRVFGDGTTVKHACVVQRCESLGQRASDPVTSDECALKPRIQSPLGGWHNGGSGWGRIASCQRNNAARLSTRHVRAQAARARSTKVDTRFLCAVIVDGRWSIDGRWSMVVGRWSMVVGRGSMAVSRLRVKQMSPTHDSIAIRIFNPQQTKDSDAKPACCFSFIC